MSRTPPPGVSYEVADVRRLAWPSGSMDALVDKATLDTLLNASELDAAAMLADAARTLRPGGVLLCITTGTPDERLPLLLAPWAADAAACSTDAGTSPAAAPCFELAQHKELRRGVHTFHVYVLRRT
jgi:ubiquinone/menaquinone biosynthesis C-methylase UbiE